jgi:uncharacterized protein YprB with RNaseH-like and TPR domain
MLTNTFLHIPYVNEATEKEIWNNGINSWDSFLEKSPNVKNKELITKYLHLSKDRLKQSDHEFFSGRLLSKYHWRAYDEFRKNCCFLDIETTGLSKERDEITTIGLYDGNESKIFINGQTLDKFPEEIKKYSFIVTFNGALFDLPFIRAKMPNIKFNHFHADLRFVLNRLGYSGGLKNIEKKMGIDRGDLEGVDGREAVRLWNRYKKHDDKAALDRLIKYNIEDVKNLKTLMEFSYGKMKDSAGFK